MFFLDTNIILYTLDRKSPEKIKRATALLKLAIENQAGIISFQVVQEFLHAATRKFPEQMPAEQLRAFFLKVLKQLCMVHSSAHLYLRALSLGEQLNYSFYDRLIIAAALEAQCSILYTEDLEDGRIIGDLKIVNPF